MDLADQLQKLQALREQSALTDDEFILAKKRVLEGTASHTCEKPAAAGSPSPSLLNQFRLSTSDKWIGGVCGGLASLTTFPSWAWRIIFLLMILLHGIGALVYILLWIFVPIQSTPVVVVEASK